MPIYKPSELIDFLKTLNVRTKKRLSQTFLIDLNILQKVILVSNLKAGDLVLEIGPGPGSWTEILLDAKAKVIAVEKDEVFAEALNRLKKSGSSLTIYNDDIMNFDIENTLKDHLKPGQKAKVIANLPFHLTTPILTKLLPLTHIFSTLVVMVQKEVAMRFCAKPKTSDYSSISVFCNFYSTPSFAFKVSKNCFFPKPSIDIAVVTFQLKKPPRVHDEERFFQTTRHAFEKRRKTLKSSLRDWYSQEKISTSLEKMNMPTNARPQELGVDEFVTLFESLNAD